MVDEQDGTDDAEGAEERHRLEIHMSPAQRLAGFASAFEESQKRILRLVAYIDRQREEIDDAKVRAREAVRAHHPGIDDETFDRTWAATQDALELRNVTPGPHGHDLAVEDAMTKLFAALPEGYTFSYMATVLNARSEGPASSVLLSSLPGALIAEFEVLLGGLIRELITLHPGLLSASERTFAWKDVIAYESLDAFKDSVVEKAVEVLLRDSYLEQMKWFEGKARVKPPSVATELATREILQRRHVHMHNGGKVSRPYLESLRGLEPEPALGAVLPVSDTYLQDASDRLLIVTLTLTARIAYSVLKDTDEIEAVERFLGDALYRLLQQQRYRVVEGVSREVIDSPFRSSYTALVVKVNGWLALKRLGRFAECSAEVRGWDTSALAPVFDLARLALLDEHEQAYEIVMRIRGTAALSVEFWFSWPLLEELRAYEERVRNTDVPLDAE